MIHTVKAFSVVDETEVNVFLEFPYFLYDPMNVGNLISGFSAFSKSSLYIWKFLVHEILKPVMQDFSFSSKDRASFNFVAAVTICSDFGAQENILSLFSLFPCLFSMK